MAVDPVTVTATIGLLQSGLLAGIFLRLGEAGTRLDHHEDRISSNESKIERTREKVREVRS